MFSIQPAQYKVAAQIVNPPDKKLSRKEVVSKGNCVSDYLLFKFALPTPEHLKNTSRLCFQERPYRLRQIDKAYKKFCKTFAKHGLGKDAIFEDAKTLFFAMDAYLETIDSSWHLSERHWCYRGDFASLYDGLRTWFNVSRDGFREKEHETQNIDGNNNLATSINLANFEENCQKRRLNKEKNAKIQRDIVKRLEILKFIAVVGSRGMVPNAHAELLDFAGKSLKSFVDFSKCEGISWPFLEKIKSKTVDDIGNIEAYEIVTILAEALITAANSDSKNKKNIKSMT